MSVAIYPGSFDPITIGHIRIAERACRLFDQVIIAVADQTYKQTLFSLDERKAFAEDAVAGLPGCRIMTFGGLTVELARATGAGVIIRGLRAISDYEYEMQVSSINKYLDNWIETVFLLSDSEYPFISSSMIKQVGRSGAKLAGLVTPMVEAAIRKKVFEGQLVN